jgi:hypothetical protein
MPSYQFPNTGSGINVDDHLNDFLVENDLQGLHSHVWPARQGFYTVEDDMDYFRGKWGFYFNAFVTGSDTDGITQWLYTKGKVLPCGSITPQLAAVNKGSCEITWDGETGPTYTKAT